MLIDDLLGRRLPASVRKGSRGRHRIGAGEAIVDFLKSVPHASIGQISTAVYRSHHPDMRRRTSSLLQKIRREGAPIRRIGHGAWKYDPTAKQLPTAGIARVRDLRKRCIAELQHWSPVCVSVRSLSIAAYGGSTSQDRRAAVARTLRAARRAGEPVDCPKRGVWRWVG